MLSIWSIFGEENSASAGTRLIFTENIFFQTHEKQTGFITQIRSVFVSFQLFHCLHIGGSPVALLVQVGEPIAVPVIAFRKFQVAKLHIF